MLMQGHVPLLFVVGVGVATGAMALDPPPIVCEYTIQCTDACQWFCHALQAAGFLDLPACSSFQLATADSMAGCRRLPAPLLVVHSNPVLQQLL